MNSGERLFNEMIGPIRDRMVRTVGRIVADPHDAADTMQIALLAVWNDLERIHRHPNPQAYILRVCISAAYDSLRRRVREQHGRVDIESIAWLPSTTPGPAAQLAARNIEEAVLRGIASLPAQQAQAVLLRIVEDEPFDAIARVLGCDEQTARSHVSKGKARLRDLLGAMIEMETVS